MITAKRALEISTDATGTREPWQLLEKSIENQITFAGLLGHKVIEVTFLSTTFKEWGVAVEDIHKVIHNLQKAGYELRLDTRYEKTFTYRFLINWVRPI